MKITKNGEKMEKAIVVGGETALKKLLSSIIKEARPGIEVEYEEDGVQACALIIDQYESIVLVIVATLELRGISSNGLIRFIRREHPKIAVILTSGYHYPQEDHGAHVFLPQPFKPGALLSAIKETTGKLQAG